MLLEDADRGKRWSLLTPLALWTDVPTEAERLHFSLNEERLEAATG